MAGVGMAMLIGPIIFGAPIAGIQSAQAVCELEKKTAEIIENMGKYITQSRKVFISQARFQEKLNKEVLKVKTSISDNLTLSLGMKKDHAIALAKLQIVAACVILLVFMLLLGKKLKIY